MKTLELGKKKWSWCLTGSPALLTFEVLEDIFMRKRVVSNTASLQTLKPATSVLHDVLMPSWCKCCGSNQPFFFKLYIRLTPDTAQMAEILSLDRSWAQLNDSAKGI